MDAILLAGMSPMTLLKSSSTSQRMCCNTLPRSVAKWVSPSTLIIILAASSFAMRRKARLGGIWMMASASALLGATPRLPSSKISNLVLINAILNCTTFPA